MAKLDEARRSGRRAARRAAKQGRRVLGATADTARSHAHEALEAARDHASAVELPEVHVADVVKSVAAGTAVARKVRRRAERRARKQAASVRKHAADRVRVRPARHVARTLVVVALVGTGVVLVVRRVRATRGTAPVADTPDVFGAAVAETDGAGSRGPSSAHA
ncbi:MAG: hypothetical protein ACXVLO_17630 [Acidimicrobiia bacterium]